jgi:hypothetical protein
MRRPDGVAGKGRKERYEAAYATWLAGNKLGTRPRYRRAHADGLQFQQWLLLTWADIVAHPDPGERERHERVGTRVDVKAALAGKDPKRASVYFSKHGAVKGDKEYQNKPPTAWLEAGTGPGRYWGYLGLKPLVASVQIDGGKDYQLVKRTMRRWAARSRYWDDEKHGYVWVSTGKRVRITRKDKETGKLAQVDVWGPRPRLTRCRSGTLCVNDGPAMAMQLARLIALTVEQDNRDHRPRSVVEGVSDQVFLCEHCGRTHSLRGHRVCRARARTVVMVR